MQAIALYALFLDEFAAVSMKPIVVTTSRKPRTDITDALRTVYWYNGIGLRTGIATATGLQKRFEPDLANRPKLDGETRKNKWGKYRVGKHVPSPELVKVVESALPGLSWELNHPLWDLLGLDAVDIDSMLRKLETPMRDRLLRTSGKKDGKALNHKPIDRVLAKSLLRNPSLDSLAAVILLFKKSIQEQNDNAALEWSREIYRQLIVLGYHLADRNIAQPLFELVETRVISPHSFKGQRYFFPRRDYISAVILLFVNMHCLKNPSYEGMSEHEKNVRMARHLNGDFGWDHQFGFNPFQADFNDPMGTDTFPAWLYKWAFHMLRSGGHRDSPPDSVFDGTDVYARSTPPKSMVRLNPDLGSHPSTWCKQLAPTC